MRLGGKRVFVSAAGQGIGRAAALLCAAEGAAVAAIDINAEALATLADAGGGRIDVATLDVLDTDAVLAYAASQHAFDGIFNCAGTVPGGTILDGTDADWDRAFALNVTATMRVTRALLPGLLARADATGSAAIVNMASMASSVKGFTNRCAYGASKAAVIGLTKSIAADFVGRNLRCNALCPATVDTPSLRGRIAASPDPEAAERAFVARQPMGRLATVDDIAPTVVFLLSDESRFVTGQAVLVDGGVTI